MHIKIPSYTCAIVLIISPSKKAQRIPRSLRRSAKISVPIYGLGRGIQWNGILPSSQSTVSVNLSFGKIDFPNITGFNQFLGLSMNDGAYILASHLKYFAGFFLCFDHPMPFFGFLDHGFFAIDMLAFFQGVNGNDFMPMICGGIDDTIHIGSVQNLSVIFGGKESLSP